MEARAEAGAEPGPEAGEEAGMEIGMEARVEPAAEAEEEARRSAAGETGTGSLGAVTSTDSKAHPGQGLRVWGLCLSVSLCLRCIWAALRSVRCQLLCGRSGPLRPTASWVYIPKKRQAFCLNPLLRLCL